MLLLLVQLPPVQRWIGGRVASALSQTLQTKVEIGSVDIGLFNRVVVNNLRIEDQAHQPFINAERVAGKIDLGELLDGKIRLSSVQLLRPDIRLYKEDDDATPNYQFFLDALKPKDKDSKRTTDIRIGSAVITDGTLRYDVRSHLGRHGGFDVNHIMVDSLNVHTTIGDITDKIVSIDVHKLAFREQCGLNVKQLATSLTLKEGKLKMSPISLRLPHSDVTITDFTADTRNPSHTFAMNNLNGTVDPSDVRCVIRQPLPFTSPLMITTSVEGEKGRVTVPQFSLNTSDNALAIRGSGSINTLQPDKETTINIDRLYADASHVTQIAHTLRQVNVAVPANISQLGSLRATGKFTIHGDSWTGKGNVECGLGQAEGTLQNNGKTIAGDIRANNLKIGTLLNDGSDLMLTGNLSFTTPATLLASPRQAPQLNLKGNLAHLHYQQFDLNNITIDGTLSDNKYDGLLAVNDPRGEVQLKGSIGLSASAPQAHLTAQVRHLNSNLILPREHGKGAFIDFDAQTALTGTQLNDLTGNIALQNLVIRTADDTYSIDHVNVSSTLDGNQRHISLRSPVGDATLQGTFNTATLASSLKGVLRHRLPALYATTAIHGTSSRDACSMDVNLYDTQWLSQLAGIDLQSDAPIHITGQLNAQENFIDMSCDMPSLIYNGKRYEQTALTLRTETDTLHINGHTRRIAEESAPLDINISGMAYDSLLATTLSFNNNDETRHLEGSLASTVQLFSDDSGQRVTHISLMPSTIIINDAKWTVQPSDVVYSKGQLIVDHVAVRNGDQYVEASGIGSNDENSKIDVNFNGLDVGLLSGLLNVKGVEFDGQAHGTVQIHSPLHEPHANAQLVIDDFCFTQTPLGRFTGRADWNGVLNAISIHGRSEEVNPLSATLIDGTIQLKPLMLDLDIAVNNTPTRFMENYLAGTIGRMDARATGGIHVFGPSKHIDIDGLIVVNGDAHIAPSNVTYTMMNDTIEFMPGRINFRNNILADTRGKQLRLNGDVFHQQLKLWTYQLNISGEDFCLLNRPTFDGNTACGNVFVKADIAIKGGKGQLDINAECTPQAGSLIQYNASEPESTHKREFIRWNDVTPTAQAGLRSDEPIDNTLPLITSLTADASQKAPVSPAPQTDIRLNMTINATPDLTLRVVMNEDNGDYIDLKGDGTLRANWFNKGAFNIFGNYLVSEGAYRMTIQNMLTRTFNFREGSNIVFAGNPFDAQLNLKAIHTVNGVSLADLQIGNSFKSNNIRVNCLMNLKGTPSAPQVDFDIDMPTAGTDAAQMVKSIINSEEELNQQVIYLLTIGRFFNAETYAGTQNEGAQSQTSLAMQSLLSGTVSQQLNNILSNVLHTNNNWTIGANISTGTEGWNNAEYEGLLSGRLLNNRLLINGQFGYRDNVNATTSFIGDFDIRYLLFPNGNLAVRVYNQTNDRYFTRNSLNTQGIGLIIKKDFNTPRDLFKKKKKLINWRDNTNSQTTDSIQ